MPIKTLGKFGLKVDFLQYQSYSYIWKDMMRRKMSIIQTNVSFDDWLEVMFEFAIFNNGIRKKILLILRNFFITDLGKDHPTTVKPNNNNWNAFQYIPIYKCMLVQARRRGQSIANGGHLWLFYSDRHVLGCQIIWFYIIKININMTIFASSFGSYIRTMAEGSPL